MAATAKLLHAWLAGLVLSTRTLLLSGLPVHHDGAAPQPWKLMTADSVFACLRGPSGVAHGPGTVNIANCSENTTQQWAFPRKDFSQGPFRIPYWRNLAYCLGLNSEYKLGTFPCAGNDHEVLWRYRIGRPNDHTPHLHFNQSYHLVHIGTGKCLRRGSVHGSVPGWLEMGTCPLITSKGFNEEPSLIVHTLNGTNMHSRKEAIATLESFWWIVVAPVRLIPQSELPLRVAGANMVGQSGRVVRVRGVNWFGFHMPWAVNNGMTCVTVEEMAQLITNLGFNVVRLSYSTQGVLENPMPPDEVLTANPRLRGKSALEIFDYQIEALTRAGLVVIICNHVTIPRWCCSLDDGNALWFNKDWTEAQWLEGLRMVAGRYRHNPRVIGVDLRNEPRPSMGRPGHKGDDPHYLIWWGHLIKHVTHGLLAVDWRAAAQEGAKAVWHGNPEALVFVEGTMGAADLSEIWVKPMMFRQDCLHSRLVYSVHDYVWFRKWFKIIKSLDFRHVYTFRHWEVNLHDLHVARGLYNGDVAQDETGTYKEFSADRDFSWGYLKDQGKRPVWVGEFGTGGSNLWWLYFLWYMAEKDVDWTYWSLDSIKFPKGFDKGHPNPNHATYDGYGLLVGDYRGMVGWKVFDLGPMLATSGMQEKVMQHPGNCTFDPLKNPVRGSGVANGVLSLQQLLFLAQAGSVAAAMVGGICLLGLLVRCVIRGIRRIGTTMVPTAEE